ncbi:MAG: hypothetical protein OXQ90_00210 [Gammaproteobacteria bacterium]|nr:hypothetical protein [Gammaproteobacteria bacterium]
MGALTGFMLALLGATDKAASSLTNVYFFDVGHWQITWAQVLKFVGFVLLWWRAVKVLVLHGSPFTFGVSMAMGRENNGISGRLVTFGHIGDDDVHDKKGGYNERFWFGCVVRSHPSSDKLVRSRVELLSMAFWHWTFLVQEGKFFFIRQTHEDRARKYRHVSDSYSKKDEHMPPDRYRKRMVDAIESMKKVVSDEAPRKRIDGLNWLFASGGYILISDDFGNRLTAVKSDGNYLVDDSETVESVQQLRTLASETLNPVKD